MFSADCRACGWESEACDTQEAAAGAGLMHLATSHAHALAAGDVSSIRVWEFANLQATVARITAEQQAEAEAAKEPPPPKGGHTERPSHDRAKEPVKGRK